MNTSLMPPGLVVVSARIGRVGHSCACAATVVNANNNEAMIRLGNARAINGFLLASSLRGAKRRGNPEKHASALDCFAGARNDELIITPSPFARCAHAPRDRERGQSRRRKVAWFRAWLNSEILQCAADAKPRGLAAEQLFHLGAGLGKVHLPGK